MANEEVFYSALHWAKKAEASAKLASELAQSGGKLIQLGFDGFMENGVLVFKHAPAGIDTPYQLVDDVEYEIDLAYNETGDLPNLTEVTVQNGGETIRFVSALHRDAMTNATVADMDAVMRYNSSTGYRWLFKAAYKVTPSGAKVFLLYPVVAKEDTSKITNCITEIPQDIKIELKDGVLTLKAGSKVYVPNGAGVFDEVVIASDVSRTFTLSNVTVLLSYIQNNASLAAQKVNLCTSGTTTPTGTGLFYNTTDNTIRGYSDGTMDTNNKWSLPLAIVTADASGNLSIDQVFNGFGYIGTELYSLPGIKVLIPDGRNNDGTLRNRVVITAEVSTLTANGQGVRYTPIATNGKLYNNYSQLYYDDKRNIYTNASGSTKYGYTQAIQYAITDGVITEFNPKLPFRSVDYSDSSWISAQAMPSGKYIDLTLGASGSSYTAPANGYFFLGANTSSTANEIVFYDTSNAAGYAFSQTQSNYPVRCMQAVRKGVALRIDYVGIKTPVGWFRFIYAEGEN